MVLVATDKYVYQALRRRRGPDADKTDPSSCWPTENLILKTRRKHYRTNIAPWHWQLRSLISAEGNDTLYFPTGVNNNHITRINTQTQESETIKVLSFHPRCLVARNGWICCGGESGEFAVLQNHSLGETDGGETTRRTNVDDALSSNFHSHLRSLESPPAANDTSLTSSFSRDMFNLLEQRLNGPTKTWTASNHKYGSERVNCITIWEPPEATSLFPARPGHYATPVAVLANNDKTVTLVGLHDCEYLDELELPDCVNRSIISPDGSLLASICDDPFLYLHTRSAVDKGRIGDSYEWKMLPRVRLETPPTQQPPRDDCRGSFAASFSSSGRYLAIGVQNGTMLVFNVAALVTAETDPLVASFGSSQRPHTQGAIRDMAFCPGPYDLLAWTEHRGRIGVADARTNFTQRQIIALDQHDDYEHLPLNDRNTIDPRLLEHRNERNMASSSPSHLARLLSQASSPQPTTNPESTAEATERLNHPFTPEETAILEAVSNERRRREAREAREQIAQEIARGSTAWRSSIWAERRDTLSRILERERRDARDQHRLAAAQAQNSSEHERERRAPTPRRRNSSTMQAALAQDSDLASALGRNATSGNNEAAASRDSSRPWAAGRPLAGWADLEALYNIAGGDESGSNDNIRVQPSRTRRAIPVINDVWNDDLTGFGTRRNYPRVSSRDHTQHPDDTAGLTWSADGQTLWVGAEDGVLDVVKLTNEDAERKFAASIYLADAACNNPPLLEHIASAGRFHACLGGGVIGLATAQRLASSHPGASTLLLERHGQVGTETSSRNSEVIHAGIYYPAASLKTRLCLRGKDQLYAFCARHGVPHARTGKWIVAQDAGERDALERLHAFCRDEIGVPTRWVGPEEMAREEPAVRAQEAALESPTSGIVDSHSLMVTLHGLFEDAGGVTALNSAVAAVEPLPGAGLPGSGGWRLTVRDVSTGEESIIETETLVNSAGLGAIDLHNSIVPPERAMKLYCAKGNYFSYGASQPKVKRLIYPMTMPGAGGLGTHLTLDMAGRLRFGPDVEWVDDPADLQVSAARLPQALGEIRKYLPDVDVSALTPDYAGIRPKLAKAGAVGPGKGFVDFYIKKEEGFEGWVNLLGMESPGLTSSLAIGDMVNDLLYGSQSEKT
ncbi:hypothetical protein JX265_000022 [Neoarthrinium moseri]|uniref:L-2-hydroxyglutarate dehydrogenase, mitochondrial n=1 Tax=Neoarthrinium moseri TaxID=1658444 RepID=A0A9P9WY13_9PEZI|nr:hypothetical protein JX265_000022 [Neoarthrinium moseri]